MKVDQTHLHFSRWLVVLFVIIVQGALAQNSKLNLQEKRKEVLHERYSVEWQGDFDKKSIDFWITANTTGYVGFGLSVSGKMDGADLVIGGVKDGKSYLNDYHGVDHSPVLDTVNHWEALNITEANGRTFLYLRRPFSTCDQNDTEITDGTVKLVWSLGADDSIRQHDLRGALAVNILDPPSPPVDLSKFQKVDVLQTINVTADKGTIYSCSIHKRTRTTPNKTHIVAFQPKFISPEATRLTHHFNAYTCRVSKDEEADSIFGGVADTPAQDCWTDNAITNVSDYCSISMYAWSFGGRILVLPEDVGIPLNLEETEYFLFEVHVDNQKREAVQITTGFTMYHTENIRPTEAGVLAIGLITGPGLLIPPKTKEWTLAGHCSPNCTGGGLPDGGINIFNVNLHSHVSGRKMKLRHFRNGTELPWVANDETYDFDFQENRPLKIFTKVLKGDHMTIECTYDSNWKAGSVIGGKSSYDEMCMVFALYHPRTAIEACFSGHDNQKMIEKFGVSKAIYNPGSNWVVQEPAKWQNRSFNDILDTEHQWNETAKKELNDFLRFGVHDDFCGVVDKTGTKSLKIDKPKFLTPFNTPHWPGVKPRTVNKNAIQYPAVAKEYEPTETACDGAAKLSIYGNFILFLALFVGLCQ